MKLSYSSIQKQVVVGMVAASLITGCQSKTAETPAATENKEAAASVVETRSLTAAQFKNMGLEFADIAERPFAQAITVNGMVDVPPENVAKVSLPITGFIKSFSHNVLPGKYVARGGVLAMAQSMEAVQLQQDYLERYAQQTFFQQELERQQTLAEGDATAKRKLQEAQNNVRVNRAMLTAMEAKLRVAGLSVKNVQAGKVTTSLAVVSPISGYVKNVFINTGSNFTPADVLFELVGTQHLHLELKVFEKDVPNLKEGQLVTVLDPDLGPFNQGKIFLIGKTFEGDTRAVNVHVHLLNEAAERKLIPGQYVRASIQAAAAARPVLPEGAFIQEGNRTLVYVLKKQDANGAIFEQVEVKAGRIANGYREVLSPLGLKNVVSRHVSFLHGGGEEE